MFENVPIKLGMTLPRLRGNELSVHNALLVDPGSAALGDFKAHVFVTSQPSATAHAGGQQDLDAMADREKPFSLSMKFLNDFKQLLVVAKEFRRPPADQQERLVIGRLYLADGKVGLNEIAGLFDVGVPTGIKVVDDAIQQFLLRRGNDWPVTALEQPMPGVKDFVLLASVVGHD